jgi:hypothetical protein
VGPEGPALARAEASGGEEGACEKRASGLVLGTHPWQFEAKYVDMLGPAGSRTFLCAVDVNQIDASPDPEGLEPASDVS